MLTHEQARFAFLHFMFGKNIDPAQHWTRINDQLQADIDEFIRKWPPGMTEDHFMRPAAIIEAATANAPNPPGAVRPLKSNRQKEDEQILADLRASGIIS